MLNSAVELCLMLERENEHVSGKRMRMFTVASQKNFFSAPSPLREQALLVFLKSAFRVWVS